MDSFELETKEIEGIQVFIMKGYFAKDAGVVLLNKAEEALKTGKVRIVLDLSQTKVISSPGVSSVLDLTFKVIDDFKGTLVLSGLNSLKMSVFKMAGVVPLVKISDDIAGGVQKACE